MQDHFRIEDQNLEQVKGKFSELFARNPDSGCRNFVELLLMSLEMRDYSERAFDADFWELDPAAVIDVETIKTIRTSDIVFKKDKMFREKLLKFFAEVMRLMIEHATESDSEVLLQNTLKWLMFLSKVPVRELRKVATELAVQSFDALINHGAEHIEERRSNKEKLADWFPTLINVIYKDYFHTFLSEKTKDIDASIRVMSLEQVCLGYKNGSFNSLDQGIVLALKRNKRNLTREIDHVKQGPLTLHALHLIFESLKDAESSPDKLMRALQHLPHTVHMMAETCQKADPEWQTEGTKFIKRNIEVLAKNKNLVKRFMDQKEEIGSLAIGYFQKLGHFPETSKLLDSKDQSQICVMITSMKKKVREAATDFFLSRIAERSAEGHKEEEEEERVSQFVRLLHEVDATIAQEITHQEGFDEAAIILRLEAFRSKLNGFLDPRRVCEMFLVPDKSHHEPEFHFRGYLGCLLYAMLKVYKAILAEDSIKSAQEKEMIEGIRADVVFINTRIKEDLKKTLVAKNLKHPELLRLHLRLIELVCDEGEDDLQELVLSVYDKSIELKTLRLNSRVLRILYERLKRESLIKSEQFSEKISRVFSVQMENLSSTVAKIRKELEKNRNSQIKDDRKLMDELRITLRKSTALKENFKTLFQLKEHYLEDAEFLMNLFIDEKLVEKEMLERVIVLLTTNITLLMSVLGSQEGIARFIKYRDTVLEYLVNLLNTKSLRQMASADANAVRRFGFLHLMETLRIVTADSLNQHSIYLKPEPQLLQQVWEFITSYCFGSAEAADQAEEGDGNPRYNASSGEKRIVSSLDEERPVASAAKNADITDSGVRLKYSDFNFKEDVQSLIAVTFRNCVHLLKSVGIMGLVGRLIDTIFQLTSDQEYFVRIIEEHLLEPLITEEKKHPLSPNTGVGVMLFTRLVQFCFEKFDLVVMKSFAKSVLNVLKKHLIPEGNDDVLRVNYRAIIYRMLTDTLDKDLPNAVEKFMLFTKKAILGEPYCQRLLFYTLQSMNNYKSKDGKEQEVENTSSPKYQLMIRVRTYLMQLCDKQFKEDENAPADQTGTKGRRDPSKSPAPARQSTKIVDERQRQDQADDKENPPAAQPKKNNRRGKAAKIVDESAPQPKSKSNSPQREASAASRGSSPKAPNGKRKIVGPKSKPGNKKAAEADSPKQDAPAKAAKLRREVSPSKSSDKAKKGPGKEAKRGGSKKGKKR